MLHNDIWKSFNFEINILHQCHTHSHVNLRIHVDVYTCTYNVRVCVVVFIAVVCTLYMYISGPAYIAAAKVKMQTHHTQDVGPD